MSDVGTAGLAIPPLGDAAPGLDSGKEIHLAPASQEALARYLDSPDQLFQDKVVGGRGAAPAIEKEQPHHRLMILLKAQGFSNVEIADQLGYTPVAVGYVLRQPWARERLMKLITEKGEAGIDTVLRSELLPSILTLAQVRDDPTSKGSEKIAACNSLIDRFLGKPVARVETSVAPQLSDVESMQRELDALKAEETRLKAN